MTGTFLTDRPTTQLLVLAKGTRGDVQPLAVVVQAVKRCHVAVEVTFATHAVHKVIRRRSKKRHK